ncbi:LRR RECEPTOR-LIKE SERINE/THREONINE-PROTEIN KINASE FLS2-RELATED [Salix koriyanagi]|uniref:LRR RECEPTOR-LIKE SERINE/THREONINE-PROTEIN KINASE FLS2-RELATED n=1 Tax=Salix koriyanagi TaxID=2511006 RepID=A0A9Q0WSQ8_9ROSI|nr:LRR RECEPTOR-LIKE SERINE/THREONINE-PROTEIN KINASE FLS2-RELATED [Salix koriyanagi]
MKSYDLSRNKLSGAIPPSISTLNYYSCLNLSFNLSGHIPSGNQLKTSDDKCIYIGNDGLCGHPMKSCPEDETSSEGHERIEDKINDQAGACWFSHGLIMGVVAGLGVCSNFHFMKSWRVPRRFAVLKMNDPFNF